MKSHRIVSFAWTLVPVVACGGSPHPAAPTAAELAVSQHVLDQETPRGAVRFASAHRGPCHTVGGDQTEAYAYDGPASCLVPAHLIDSGVFGCPTAMTLPGEDGDRLTFAYDALGRMVHADDATFAWSGARLVGVQAAPGLAFETVRAERDRIVLDDDDGPAAMITLAGDGLPRQVTRFAGGAVVSHAVLAYQGARLASVSTELSGTSQRLAVEYCDVASN